LELLEDRCTPSTLTLISAPNPSGALWGITAGPDGNLWFADYSHGEIGQITPTGAITEYSLPAHSSPVNITPGPDGALWFTDSGTGKIGRITTTGAVTEYSTPAGTNPFGIATGPDGNLWFTDVGGDGAAIDRMTTAGVVIRYALPNLGSYPQSIVAGPDGNLWFTEGNTNEIGRITTSGAITEYALPAGSSGPEGITVGPNGNLWFTENGSNQIGEITTTGVVTEFNIPTAGSEPYDITAGGDGNLWFTQSGSKQIGRITPDGTVTEFNVPTSTPIGITAGPDGNVWFTTYSSEEVGVVTQLLAVSPTSLPAATADNAYYALFAGSGGSSLDPTYSYAATGLPSGMNFTSTGLLWGTPSVPGTYNITVTATFTGNPLATIADATGSTTDTLVVNPAITVSPGTVPNGTVGSSYSQQFSAGGGSGSGYSYSAAGNLDGLTLSSAGLLSGTPSAAGSFSFTITATDSNGDSGSQTCALVVANPPVFLVTSTADNPADILPGELRWAIDEANANPGSTIAFDIGAPGSSQTIAVTGSALPNITAGVLVDGWTQGGASYSGAPLITIDGSNLPSGNGLNVAADGVQVRGLDIQNFAGNGLALTQASAESDNWIYGDYLINNAGSGLYVASAANGNLIGTNADGIADAAERNIISGNKQYGISLNSANNVVAGNYIGVVADGHTAMPNVQYGIDLSGGSNRIGGTAAGAGNVISGNSNAGILIVSSGNTVQGNLVGTDATGTSAVPNGAQGILISGKLVSSPAANNLIGGTTAGAGNIIAGNANNGLQFNGPAVYDNVAEGNSIGTNAVGATNLGNASNGVAFSQGAHDNTLGGTAAGAGNVIAYNATVGPPPTLAGVALYNANTIDDRISGNSIYDNNGLGIDIFANGVSLNNVDPHTTASPNLAQNFPILTGATSANGVITITGTLNAAAGTTYSLEFFGNPAADPSGYGEGQVFLGSASVTTDATGNVSFTVHLAGSLATHEWISATGTDPNGNTSEFSNDVESDNPPKAVNDFYQVNQGSTLNIPATVGVLANDSDPDGDSLTASLGSGPQHGSVTLNSDGSFSYTPTASFSGTDSFSYMVSDGLGGTATGTAVIQVNPVNLPPVVASYSYTTLENKLLTVAAPGVLTNDTDPNGNALTASLLLGAANGQVTVNSNGSFTYQPNTDFNGTDSFAYQVSDGHGDFAVGMVQISVTPVNQQPSFSASNPPASNENAGPQTVDHWALFNPGAANESGQTATYTVQSVSNAALFAALPSVDANGTLTYTAASDANGTSTFTVYVTDSGGTANGGNNTSATQTFTITVNAVNQPPSFTASNPPTVSENAGAQTVTSWATFNPGAANESTQTATYTILSISNPSLFAVAPSVSPTGTLTYTPAVDANGTSTFTVQVQDSGGTANGGVNTSAPQTFTITVNAVNQQPSFSASNPPASDENAGPQTVDHWALFNPGAPNESAQTATYTVQSVSKPSLFAVLPSVDANGTLTYTAAANASGSSTFTVFVKDSGGTANGGKNTSASQTFTITVNPSPVPVAQSYSYTIDENSGLGVSAPYGVLSQDSDSGGGTLTASVLNGPANGELTLHADGSFIYFPNQDFNGTDSFSYKVTDSNGNFNVGTVTLTVNFVNQQPYFTASDPPASTENAGPQTVNSWALFNPGAPNEFNQTANYTVENVSNPTLFAVLPSVDANGTLTYTAASNVSGTSTFDVVVQDSGGTANGGVDTSDPQTFTITINPVTLPPVTNPASYITNENTPLVVPASAGVLASDYDPNGYPLTASLLNGPANGTLNLNPDGSFTYTPNLDFNGTDSFSYQVSDGNGGTALGSVSLTVNYVNQQPSFTASNPPATSENAGPQTVNNWALFNPGAPNEFGQTATYSLVDLSNPLLFSAPPSVDANGMLTYTAAPHVSGNSTFTIAVQDNGGTANGGIDTSNPQTFTITITPVNQPPVTKPASYSTNENVPLVVAANAGVLANDHDPDGDTLTASLLNGPANGTLHLNADGSFTYTPNLDFNGTDSFSYQVSDGNGSTALGSVSLTVNFVNQQPSFAASDPPASNENAGPQTVNNWALFNPGAPNEFGQTATYSLVDLSNPLLFSAPPSVDANGTLTYTAAPNASGSSTFTIAVQDNGGTANGGIDTSVSQTFTITINPVNLPPVTTPASYVTNENVPLVVPANAGVLANDYDPDGDTLTASLLNGPANGTLHLNADGSFTYTPNLDFNGTDSFSYQVSDGNGGTALGSVSLTVNFVNQQPGFTASDPPASNENAGPQTVNNWAVFNPGAPNEFQQTATYTVYAVNNPTLFSVLPSVDSNGTLTYTAAPNASGSAAFSVYVQDNGGTANGGGDTSNLQVFNITINRVNLPPVANPASYTTNENTPLVVAANAGVLANASDPDGDTLTASLVNGPANGTVNLNADGSFTYTPNLDFNGTDSFSYQVSDGNGGTAISSVSLTVNYVNQQPSFMASNPPASNENAGPQTVNSWALFNPGAPNEFGQTATYTVQNVSSPSLFAVLPSVDANGTLTYTAAVNASGTSTFAVSVQDSGGTANGGVDTSGVQVFTITVNPANQPPVTNPISYSTNENVPLVVPAAGVLTNDSDPDGDTLTASLLNGPAHGTVSLNADGSFIYTPATDYFGSDSFTYQAADGRGAFTTGTVNLTVNFVNQQPSFAATDPPASAEDAGAQTVEGWAAFNPGAPSEVGQSATYTVQNVSNPALFAVLPSVDANGTLTYTAATNATGSATFSVFVQDSGGTANGGNNTSAPQMFTITVYLADVPPVANPDSYVVQQNGSLTVSGANGVLANDTDIEGNPLTASLLNGPSHGTLNLNSDGSFTYTPQPGYIGVDSFTYTASDGLGGSTAAITLTVSGPVYAFDDAYAAIMGQTLNVSASAGVLHNDVDFDRFFGISDTFTASLLTGPSHGSLTFNADGSFSYTPDLGYFGADGFTYQASNGLGGTATASVYLNVSPSANVFLVTRTFDSDSAGQSNLPGTLRWAINQANLQSNSTIQFDIPTSDPGYNPATGTWTIEVSSGVSLPGIGANTGVVAASSVLIDGWSQGGPGYQGPPLIVIDGSQTDNQSGLSIEDVASDVTIRGLTIQNFHADFLPDEGAGLTISAPAANAHIYDDQFLNNDTYGVLVYSNSSDDTFQDDVISGNGFGGLYISSQNNVLEGNTITGNGGLLPAQPYQYVGFVPSSGFGVFLTGSDNIVGAPGAGNVISGNDGPGVWIYSAGNTIQGNDIGTNATGAQPQGNAGSGVLLSVYASDNLIGGAEAGDGNVIAANQGNGLEFSPGTYPGSSVDNNTVEGNWIGTNPAGITGLGNQLNGVLIDGGADNNTIGGTLAGTANVIADNNEAGVSIYGGSNTFGERINGNSIYGNGQLGIDERGRDDDHRDTHGCRQRDLPPRVLRQPDAGRLGLRPGPGLPRVGERPDRCLRQCDVQRDAVGGGAAARVGERHGHRSSGQHLGIRRRPGRE